MSSKDYAEEIFKIERFNLNAKKLKESEFFKWFYGNKLNIDFLITKDSPRKIFPPDSYFKEFLMTFLNCIKDEQNSIHAIADIYGKLESNNKLKTLFQDYHESLNLCLFTKPFKTVSKLDEEIQVLTMVALLDIFLYGEFIGDHPQKVELYHKITQERKIREFYWFEFYMNVYKCTLLISQIFELNESLLRQLKS